MENNGNFSHNGDYYVLSLVGKNVGPTLGNIVSEFYMKRLPKNVGIMLVQCCLVKIMLKQYWEKFEKCCLE